MLQMISWTTASSHLISSESMSEPLSPLAKASDRLADVRRFYEILDDLRARLAGGHALETCHGRMNWPERGVYFFFEDGEVRTHSGVGPRVVRIGTHALKAGSKTSLWNRLSQHRGVGHGGGNHRGSIFRLHVGKALLTRHREIECPSWGCGQNAARDVRLLEQELEARVSQVIRHMPFLWLEIGDSPGPNSTRGYIERSAIALLSNYGKSPIDPPSEGWLGKHCPSERVRRSGLWNSHHIDEPYDPGFLDQLQRLVAGMPAR